MTDQTQIEQVEVSIEQAKKVIARGLAIEKLSSNRDFKKLIMDEYFGDEAARLAHLYSEPTFDTKQKEFVHNDLCGIGAFKRYLTTAVQMGRNMQNELTFHEETLEELRLEGENE